MEIEAPAEIRAAVAKLASVRDMPHLAAVFDLSRHGAAVHVTGQVDARVGQTCVVTLEPLETTVAEPVDVTVRAGRGRLPRLAEHERTAERARAAGTPGGRQGRSRRAGDRIR